MYPVVKDGFKQVAFSVPAKANENDLKIEVFVGADRLVDCNAAFMAGTMQAQTVEGFGAQMPKWTLYLAQTNKKKILLPKQ